MRFTLYFLIIFIPVFTQASDYLKLDTQCDGLMQLPIGSMPNTCVGLLAGNEMEVGFKKPRKAIQIPGTFQIVVTDMGSWSPNKGSVWLLDFSKSQSFSGEFVAYKILDKLVLPHEIKIGPDQKIYIGEAHKISRFELVNHQVVNLETVIQSLPYQKDGYRHPLSSFIFLDNYDLLVNVGSKSDSCVDTNKPDCDNINEVGLRHYEYLPKSNLWNQQHSMYATGLRNSVALVQHHSGTILQAENSSDIKDANEPYEEINVITKGKFYGWPYCLNRFFDQKIIAKGCEQTNYQAPFSLMPPHTAPLDMFYYQGDLLEMLNQKLIISWHGYRVVGNRVVAYDVDKEGKPILIKQPTFNRDPFDGSPEFGNHVFSAKGGSNGDAQAIEIISYWNAVEGLRPEGAPVGLTQLSDGSILIVDDKNKNLLRLSKGVPYIDSTVVLNDNNSVEKTDEKSELTIFPDTKKLMIKECAQCHVELVSQPAILLNDSAWLKRDESNVTILENKLTSGLMPPSGALSQNQIEILLKGLK